MSALNVIPGRAYSCTMIQNVIFDEIEIMRGNHSVDGIILDERSRSIHDFTYLINMIYRDNENSCLYVVTRIGISHWIAEKSDSSTVIDVQERTVFSDD